ncbi:MAG: hypothetical protein JW782_07410 [Candidatus Saganbacteria bacterium]|nr:hypothetical protein [Candidatus Saganbacteria bacterium]
MSATLPRITVDRINQLRGGYVNRRSFYYSLRARIKDAKRLPTLPGYHPAVVEMETSEGPMGLAVRDYDVPFLRRTERAEAVEYLQLILDAKAGNKGAQKELDRRIASMLSILSKHFRSLTVKENDYLVSSTTNEYPAEEVISNKGAILLRLIQEGYPVPDFTFLTSRAYHLTGPERDNNLHDAIMNMQRLTGQEFGGESDPLLLAMRCAMPTYIPGFMPTYLNVGVTEKSYPALVERYGEEAALRILVNNLKTMFMVLDPAGFQPFAKTVRPDLDAATNRTLADQMMTAIRSRDLELLTDPFYQISFLLNKAYEDFEAHLDLLRNFMRGEEHYPTMILQKMVCSALNDASYAGVLYSRHPRNGQGSRLQFARSVFGEEIMTGGFITPSEKDFSKAADIVESHPAVSYFHSLLERLETRFAGPVTVEFAAENGLFAMLQLNPSELTGSGTVIAVMDMYRKGQITAQRVRELIQPYHIKQLESPAIDRRSIEELEPFAQGISILPRTAISGKLYLNANLAAEAKARGESVILAQQTFLPTDTISMSKVDGIVSLTPAAIHVVTTAQNLGIPSLLNLESQGVTIDRENNCLRRPDGMIIEAGEWVTISSRFGTLFAGQARFSEARLRLFISGKDVSLTRRERPFFEQLARDYSEYLQLAEAAQLDEISTMRELAKIVEIDLRGDKAKGDQLVNDWVAHDQQRFLDELFDSGLGDHLRTGRIFDRLTVELQDALLKAAADRGLQEKIAGAEAGGFILGRIMTKARSIDFWKSLTAAETAYLLNEWVHNEEYCEALSFAGERKIRKAMEYLRSDKFPGITLRPVIARTFFSLKLSQVDLDEIAALLPESASPQTRKLIELVSRPWGKLVDYSKPWEFGPLEDLCREAGVPVPAQKSR